MMGSLDKSLSESIVVLGSSSLNSLECSVSSKTHANSDDMNENQDFVKLDYNGELNENHSQFSFDKASNDHVKIEDEKAMESMMIASNIISSSSSSELQKKLANILDENNLLRKTLKENNTSIKEQFKTIVAWRDDVMKTYSLHRNKFAETKEIIDKLEKENLQQKSELETMKSYMLSQYNRENSPEKLNMSSYEELVDDSKVNLLTDRLEVIEKEKRKILHENEDLRWQKDSLQQIVDNNISEIQELKMKLDIAESNESSLKNSIKLLETKATNIQEELRAAQYKLSESENFKIEHSQYKQTSQNTIRHLKIEVQELKAKLKDAYILTLQPLRFSLDLEENHNSEHYETYTKNIEIYDKILKDLSSDLNVYTTQFCTLLENFSAFKDFKGQELKEEAKTILNTINNQVDLHHKSVTQRNQKVKSLLSSFEKIFNDFQDIIKITKTNKIKLNECAAEVFKKNDELAEAQNELVNLRQLVTNLQKDSDLLDLLKAQIELFKSDFEAERKARTEIAAEKQSLVEQMRALHISKQKLVEEFDVYCQSQQGNSDFRPQESSSNIPPVFTEIYCCPVCQDCFDSTDTLQEHANSCIDRMG